MADKIEKPTITIEYDPNTKDVTWRSTPGFPPKEATNACLLIQYFFAEMQIVQMQALVEKAPHARQFFMPDGAPAPRST